jgi:hypothetical protein
MPRQFSPEPDATRRAVLEHYSALSAAYYRILTEGLPDGTTLTPDEAKVVEDAMRIVGHAIEGEVFGAREQGEGGHEDDVPGA